MMTGLAELTIAAARDSLRAGDLTAAELAEACLGAAEGAATLNAGEPLAINQDLAEEARDDEHSGHSAAGVAPDPLGGVLVFGTHFGGPSTGHLVTDADSYRFDVVT